MTISLTANESDYLMTATLDFNVKILADSYQGECGEERAYDSRLVTAELTYPRCIHSEFMTHRQFSRNAASSRAIPIEKMMQNVKEHPFIPLVWGLNQSGMQSRKEHKDKSLCIFEWGNACQTALFYAKRLNDLGLHKQIVNRILEPWMWITVIATGVDHAWENFFKLRCHKDAEPHIQHIAYMMREAYDTSEPNYLGEGDYHLPLFGFDQDFGIKDVETKKKLSTARCARVSYLTHEGERDVEADIKLHDRLAASGHWSPFEHVARPLTLLSRITRAGGRELFWLLMGAK